MGHLLTLLDEMGLDKMGWHQSGHPQEVTLIELTVCFETTFEAAIQRRTEKYLELREEAQNIGYRAEIMTNEIGSWGVVSVMGFKAL